MQNTADEYSWSNGSISESSMGRAIVGGSPFGHNEPGRCNCCPRDVTVCLPCNMTTNARNQKTKLKTTLTHKQSRHDRILLTACLSSWRNSIVCPHIFQFSESQSRSEFKREDWHIKLQQCLQSTWHYLCLSCEEVMTKEPMAPNSKSPKQHREECGECLFYYDNCFGVCCYHCEKNMYVLISIYLSISIFLFPDSCTEIDTN